MILRHPKHRLLALVPLLAAGLAARNLAEFEKKVSEFTLGNGMHFLAIERPQAPVVSFHMHVNAGSADDPGGQTGLAHMFEHMIGKGTETIGSLNADLEKSWTRKNAGAPGPIHGWSRSWRRNTSW